jgi:hypothetical protein
MTDKARNDQLEGHLPNLRNLLVNGGFEVWQRGVGPFTVNGKYTADEWQISRFLGSETLSVSRDASPKIGLYDAICTAVTAPGGSVGIKQGIENYKSYEGLYVTFSAWVKTSTSSAVQLVIEDNSGVGGGGEISDPHTGSGNWERLTVSKRIQTGLVGTALLPHSSAIGISIASSASATFQADGASLVVGNFPGGVPYDLVPSGEDLGRCQRFYYKSKGQIGRHVDGPLVAQNMHTIPFPSPMAAIPTITLSNIVFAGTGIPPLTGTANDLRSWALGLTNLMGPSYAEAQYDVEIEVP